MKGKSTRDQYEKYVCNIDVAQRLFACGFAYPTMFYWVANPQLDILTLYRTGVDLDYMGPPEHKFPAPTAMELKENYPDEVWVTTATKSLHRRKGLFYFTKYNGAYIVSLMVKGDTEQVYEFHREEDTSEANACGTMFAYIFENHLNEVHN
jgi:hypothetical protein